MSSCMQEVPLLGIVKNRIQLCSIQLCCKCYSSVQRIMVKWAAPTYWVSPSQFLHNSMWQLLSHCYCQQHYSKWEAYTYWSEMAFHQACRKSRQASVTVFSIPWHDLLMLSQKLFPPRLPVHIRTVPWGVMICLGVNVIMIVGGSVNTWSSRRCIKTIITSSVPTMICSSQNRFVAEPFCLGWFCTCHYHVYTWTLACLEAVFCEGSDHDFGNCVMPLYSGSRMRGWAVPTHSLVDSFFLLQNFLSLSALLPLTLSLRSFN